MQSYGSVLCSYKKVTPKLFTNKIARRNMYSMIQRGIKKNKNLKSNNYCPNHSLLISLHLNEIWSLRSSLNCLGFFVIMIGLTHSMHP